MSFKKISLLLIFFCIVGLCMGSASAMNKKDSKLVGIVDQDWASISGMLMSIDGSDVEYLSNEMIKVYVYDFSTGNLTYTKSDYTNSNGLFRIPLTLSKGINLVYLSFDGDNGYNKCNYLVATTVVS